MEAQIILFGHSLSDRSKQFLSQLVPNAKVYKVDFHITRFNEALKEVDKIFDDLRSEGADLSARTRTIIVPPGSSVGTAILIAGWFGLTGDFPEVLNLIRMGDNVYGPSPETPVLFLDKFVDEKLVQDIELISLQSLKSRIRQNKRAARGPGTIEVEQLGNYTPRPPKRQFNNSPKPQPAAKTSTW